MKKNYQKPLVEQTDCFAVDGICKASPGVSNPDQGVGEQSGGLTPMTAPGRKVF